MKNSNFKVFELTTNSKRSLSFLPGTFFITLGLLVLFFPKLFIAALSAFLLFVGGIFCYVAWKVIQIRNRFETFTKDVESKIQTQGFHVTPTDIIEVDSEEKKIIFH